MSKKKPKRRRRPIRPEGMIQPKRLRMGVDSPSPGMVDEESRVAELQATIQHYIPEFARAIAEGKAQELDFVTIHQDAFAAGYHDDEYTLFGMALKYAGLSGVSVMVIGTNHETF